MIKKILISCLALFGIQSVAAQDCSIVVSLPSYQGQYQSCSGDSHWFFFECQNTGVNVLYWYVAGPNGYYDFFFTTELNIAFSQPGAYRVECVFRYPEESEEQPPHSRFEFINVATTPATPIISIDKTGICLGESVTLSINNLQTGVTYYWDSSPSGYSGQGTNITFDNITTTTSFQATVVSGSCQAISGPRSVFINNRTGTLTLDPSTPYHRRILKSNGSDYLQTDPSGQGQDKSVPRSTTYIITEPGTFYVRAYYAGGDCWGVASALISVTEFNYVPPLPVIGQSFDFGFNSIFLANQDKDFVLQFADYFWVDGETGTQTDKTYENGDKIFSSGTYYLRGKDRGTGTWGPTLVVQVVLLGDDNINWIKTASFDGTSSVIPYAESKSYFDESGAKLQAQMKTHTKDGLFILTSGILRDRYDQIIGETLLAPILSNEFKYTSAFVVDATGKLYDYKKFDTDSKVADPDPVGHVEGTVGGYYKENNSGIPVTDFPYSRIEFYQDGTGEVKRSAGPGEAHRSGSGHELLSGTFPVYHELDDYLSKRVVAIPGITQDGNLMNEGVQSVVRDQNGKYAVSISDKSGKTVMSARRGTSSDYTFSNTITSSNNPSSGNFRPMTYFYILHPQAVRITGSTDFVVEDIVSGERKSAGVTFAGGDGKWPDGFYRILLSNPSSEITLTYTNYFADISYQFYDDAGRLKASVSPNGYKALKNGTDYGIADKTTYQYNHRGWLLSMTEPDAGTTNYKYRKDGRIRFSQNALQKENETNGATGKGRFSYTNYDESGRPVESGEYIGSAAFSSLNDKLEFNQQVSYGTNEKKDWVKTHFDFPAEGIPNLPPSFKQDFVRGAVSWTENANIKTWYSYDELGRMVWMAQKPVRLNRTFVVKYTYDFLGNVLTVFNASYISGEAVDPFYHHYEYDKDKRLTKAHTSTDGSTKKLRATYEYYLHGPLKRIELGDKLQGIDFVYNINGWLTQINHPDNAQDPGGDGMNGVKEDVFGMILDYYQSDLNKLFPTSSIGPYNLDRFHGLPSEASQTLLASHQPLIRFSPFEEYRQEGTSMFKEYSAEHQRYREMISEIIQHPTNK